MNVLYQRTFILSNIACPLVIYSMYNYVCIMHQLITVTSNTYTQIHVPTKDSLAHLQNLIPILAGDIALYTLYQPR